MLNLPKLIAHRGASLITPENTLIAFEKAHALGATWVEFDVMIMRDGTLIVHHDDTFEKVLGLAQSVHETPYAQIAHKDAGSWFDPAFSHARIPTLAQTLDTCARLNLSLNIELKTSAEYAQATARATLDLLAQFESFTPENVLISSQTPRALQTVHQHAPDYALGLVAGNWQEVEDALTQNIPLYSLNLHYPLLTAEKMAWALQQGYQVLSFTVNSPGLAAELFARGVTSIFSDDVLLLNGYPS